jgi:LPXTG-motif cell wall-anchored protein
VNGTNGTDGAAGPAGPVGPAGPTGEDVVTTTTAPPVLPTELPHTGANSTLVLALIGAGLGFLGFVLRRMFRGATA